MKTTQQHVATMFIDEVISNGDFIAIHWRYDKDDWLAANCKEGVSEFMQTKCDQIHEVCFVSNFFHNRRHKTLLNNFRRMRMAPY